MGRSEINGSHDGRAEGNTLGMGAASRPRCSLSSPPGQRGRQFTVAGEQVEGCRGERLTRTVCHHNDIRRVELRRAGDELHFGGWPLRARRVFLWAASSYFARFTRATHKIENSAKRSAYTVRPSKSRFSKSHIVTLKMQRPVQEMQRKVRSALQLPAETLPSRPHRHLSPFRWQRAGEGRAGAGAWLTSSHPLTHRLASSRRSPCAASSRASRSSPLTLAPPPSSAPSRSTRTRSTSRSASSTRSAAALTPRSVHGRDPTLFL